MKTKIYTLNAPDGEIRYAGKTSKTLEHRLQEHLAETCRGAKNHRCNWIRSLVEKNESPIIHLLAEVEGNGSKEEIKTIANFRAQGIRLTNQTDGGEGMSGWHPSPETLKKQSKAQKGSKNHMYGKHRPKEVKEKISRATKGRVSPMKGKHVSKESKRKNSEAHKGRISGFKGKHHSEESNRKNSDAHKGQIPWNKGKTGVYTPEMLTKMSEGHKGQIPWDTGKHFPEAVKKKQSAARKKCWAKRKRNQITK